MKHNMRTTYNCNIEKKLLSCDCNYNNNGHYHASMYIYNYTVLTAGGGCDIIVYNNMVYDHDEVSGTMIVMTYVATTY